MILSKKALFSVCTGDCTSAGKIPGISEPLVVVVLMRRGELSGDMGVLTDVLLPPVCILSLWRLAANCSAVAAALEFPLKEGARGDAGSGGPGRILGLAPGTELLRLGLRMWSAPRPGPGASDLEMASAVPPPLGTARPVPVPVLSFRLVKGGAR